MPGDYPALHRLENALQPVTGNLSGPFQMTISGTVNTIGGGTGGTAVVDNSPFTAGGTSITPVGGYQGGRTVASGRTAAFAIDGSGNMQVNVVAGGAGGGVANITMRGTAGANVYVGVASGPAGLDGNYALPVLFASGYYPTINTVGGGGGFATVGVYGSVSMVGSAGVTQLGAPWTVVGSMGVTPLVTFTANVVGSLGVGQLNAPWSMTGSVNAVLGTLPVPMVGSVNVGNFPPIQVVDTRGSMVPTTWPISGSGGVFQGIACAASPNRVYLYGLRLITSATVDMQIQSPSGTTLDGSARLLPGAGFVEAHPLGTPAYIAPVGSGNFVFNLSAAAQVSGIARGWVGP